MTRPDFKDFDFSWSAYAEAMELYADFLEERLHIIQSWSNTK